MFVTRRSCIVPRSETYNTRWWPTPIRVRASMRWSFQVASLLVRICFEGPALYCREGQQALRAEEARSPNASDVTFENLLPAFSLAPTPSHGGGKGGAGSLKSVFNCH